MQLDSQWLSIISYQVSYSASPRSVLQCQVCSPRPLFSLVSILMLSLEACPNLPKSPQLHQIAKLPDPFAWYPAASNGRVSNLLEWQCRQEDVAALLQEMELGTKPRPPSKVTSSFIPGTTGTLVITAAVGDKAISFNVTIQYPEHGKGPFPAMIAYGGLSIPLPNNVAAIIFDNSVIAQQDSAASRGLGLFYQLYGTDASAGALIAWAWATSLVLDLLELTPEANVDVTRIGITGCSRNGKGALVAGAYDPRIVLTVPQESGSGGSACWRLSYAEEGAPELVQTSGEIITENVWFSTAFDAFANETTLPLLAFDHHMLAGLIAPRALFVIDNVGYQWLGPWSCWGCMKVANQIWQALGVPDDMGFSMAANHTHCNFPDYQQPELFAFIDKFLLNRPADTAIQKDYANISFDVNDWVTWSVPQLAP
jgi:hypothetical protein